MVMGVKNITAIKVPHIILQQLQRMTEEGDIIFSKQDKKKSDAVLIWGKSQPVQSKNNIVFRLAKKPIHDKELFFHQEMPLSRFVSEISQILHSSYTSAENPLYSMYEKR